MQRKPRKHPKKEKRVSDAIYESEQKEMEKALKKMNKEFEKIKKG